MENIEKLLKLIILFICIFITLVGIIKVIFLMLESPDKYVQCKKCHGTGHIKEGKNGNKN